MERVVAAFMDGPGRKLGGIRDFLKREQVAQALEYRGRAQALHALENNNEISKTGAQFGIFNDFEEALAADSEKEIAVAYFCVVFIGQQARFGVGPVALVHGKSVTFCMVAVQCLGGEGR